MKCPRCQAENPSQAKFCEQCGNSLAPGCSNGGAQLSPTARFCAECGHPASPAAPPPAGFFASPQSYTPKHLAEKILTSKSALEGERKQVTVLFADLKGSYYSQLRLDALPAESAGELLDALLGEDPALDPLKQILIRRGNPFFLEETVRTLVETKALDGPRGRYRLTHPVQALQVPATVQAMLAARIDRLPPEDKRLLQVASVVGKDVPFALLQVVAELPDEALRRGLDHLQAAEFLYETGPIRISSTPSSTRSPTTSPTAACCMNGAARCTHGSATRSRRSSGIASTQRSSGSPITPSGASCGRRHCATSGRPE